MKFIATEAGFKNGMGGASNSESENNFHYVLFGIQVDGQHPENNSVYFEHDDQSNGTIDSVKPVLVNDSSIIFELKDGKTIEIVRGVNLEQWSQLKQGIATVFQKN